jgi:valyl-tRNA synthetase
MRGKVVTWSPGLDHAGIATQSVVERHLRRAGIWRENLARDEFVSHVWQWKERYGDEILSQLDRLGCSFDWHRLAFTMDASRELATRHAFVQLHGDGLVYRAHRLVHWCSHLQTALSDIEIEYEEVDGRRALELPDGRRVDVGLLYDVDYRLCDGSVLTVSTTRPETILADEALAVHPADERYTHLIGARAAHPLCDGVTLPIVGDAQLVDADFGSGVVKVTPAHDANDFACGLRHGLPLHGNVLRDDGALNARVPSRFAGVDRFDARRAIVDELRERGALRDVRDHSMRLARCSRSGDIVEPRLKRQWYVKTAPLAARAADFVRSGRIKIAPSHYESEWFRWLDNCQDWCVSRQLYWGHRVPAYRVQFDDSDDDAAKQSSNGDGDDDEWIVAESEEEARAIAAQRYGYDRALTLRQDDDVLDTWFSSALLPLSQFGWPAANDELGSHYPLSLMETGADILFFWVARMAMLCGHLHADNAPPFEHVYLHPMVRDARGRKMSKSLGNVIDPRHVIEGISLERMRDALASSNVPTAERVDASEALARDFPDGIAECGTDALRFALLGYLQQGVSINLDVNRVLASRHFCNKIWQASRFALAHLVDARDFCTLDEAAADASGSFLDAWLLSRLAHAVVQCNEALDHSASLMPSRATDAIHRFVIAQLCDVYIECAKVTLAAATGNDKEAARCRRILFVALETMLRLVHPIMPFVSDQIYVHLRERRCEVGGGNNGRCADASLSHALSYPSIEQFAPLRREALDDDVDAVLALVHSARSLRDAVPKQCNDTLAISVLSDDAHKASVFGAQSHFVRSMTRVSRVNIVESAACVPRNAGVRVVDHSTRIFVSYDDDVAGGLATATRAQRPALMDHERELAKIGKQRHKLERQLESLQRTMSAPNYASRVPAHVQEQHRERISNDTLTLERLAQTAEAIESLQ